MPRLSLPLVVGDLSGFARALKAQLALSQSPPGHQELLNMLARAGGFRNFQHLRAQALAAPPRPAPEPAPTLDQTRLRRLARHFDAQGRLARWPGKRSMEEPCLWALWARIPARRVMNEAELGELLRTLHSFGDHALLRRGLCDCGLMERSRDGSRYRRVERKPPAEALALMGRIRPS